MKWLFFVLIFWGALWCNEQNLIVDRYFSPFMGSADLLFTENVLVAGFDAIPRSMSRNRTGQIWARAGMQFLFWANLNRVVSITQHEFFGHGYRLRELGQKPTKYEIKLWGGATHFAVSNSFPLGKILAIDVAGLEAEGILAWDLKMQWLRCGAIDGRLASLYTQAQQSIFFYTWITNLGEIDEKSLTGNDVESYIAVHNAMFPDQPLSIGLLTRLSIFNWFDPMTFYAYFAFFYYIAEGKSWEFPMIHLGEQVRYLPNLRLSYAPYSPEIYFENFLVLSGEPLYLYLRKGKKCFGMGWFYDRLIEGNRGSIGVSFDWWYQRKFLSNASIEDFEFDEVEFSPVLDEMRFGIAGSLVMRLKLAERFALFAQAGGKTAGYLPGYSLSGDVFGRVGFTVKFGKCCKESL